MTDPIQQRCGYFAFFPGEGIVSRETTKAASVVGFVLFLKVPVEVLLYLGSTIDSRLFSVPSEDILPPKKGTYRWLTGREKEGTCWKVMVILLIGWRVDQRESSFDCDIDFQTVYAFL